MKQLAAIDVGSNAIRMVVATLNRDREIISKESLREPVRMGADVFSSGRVEHETLERAEQAFVTFQKYLEEREITVVRAIGTSALREATNGDQVIDRIHARTGIRIELIEGTEEARLVQLAVAQKVDLKNRLAVLIDLGGGSTEVSIVHDGDMVVSESHKVGAVRLLRLFDGPERSRTAFSLLLRDYVSGLRAKIQREIGRRRVDLCVGTGGNFEALRDLQETLLGDKRKELTLKNLELIIEKIESLSVEERVKKFNLRPDRADVVVPAACVIREILREAKVSEVQVPSIGLKDGVLLDMIGSLSGDKHAIRRRQILTYARELGRRYNFDEAHGERVAGHAAVLFDDLKSLHRLNEDCKLLLETAALMHDVGQFISSHDHHKHSMYLIRATPLFGLNKRDQDLVACIARYHRKASPKVEHELYKELAPDEREKVRLLSALLRVADALDRPPARSVERISCKVRGKEVVIKLTGSGEMLLERWSLVEKGRIFKEEFGKDLRAEI